MYRREPESSDSDHESPRMMIRKNSANLSELEKLVIEAENIYNVVKSNGLTSSVYYQIGIIHPRENNLKIKTKLTSIQEE
jgi:lysozyme family protein